MYNKEDGLYYGYIYKATCIINNKSYIGQTTVSINDRKSAHITKALKKYDNLPFHNALNYYGIDNFDWFCLHSIVCETKNDLYDTLNNYEINEIASYNTMYPNGYNIDKGGNSSTKTCRPVDCYDLNGNYIQSFESCAEAARYCNGFNNIIIDCLKGKIKSAYGYVWVDKGKEFIPYQKIDNSIKVDCYDKNNNYIKTFNSLSSASKFLNIDNSGQLIKKCMNGEINFAYGYKWTYENQKPISKLNAHIKIVDCYTKDNIFVKSYLGGAKEASLDLNISAGGIKQCCQGKLKTSGGFIWKYHMDDVYTNKKRKVNCYDLDNVFIQTFNSVKEGSEVFNCAISGIYNCINKKCEKAKNYKWFYADDPNQPDKSRIIY